MACCTKNNNSGLNIFFSYIPLIILNDSSVGRASAFGAGGRGSESRGPTIPKV